MGRRVCVIHSIQERRHRPKAVVQLACPIRRTVSTVKCPTLRPTKSMRNCRGVTAAAYSRLVGRRTRHPCNASPVLQRLCRRSTFGRDECSRPSFGCASAVYATNAGAFDLDPRRCLGIKSTIDGQRRTRHVVGCRTGQKCDSMADIGGDPIAAERCKR